MPRRICAYKAFAATSRTHTPQRSPRGLWKAKLFATHSWEHMTDISMKRIISYRKANQHPPRFEQVRFKLMRKEIDIVRRRFSTIDREAAQQRQAGGPFSRWRGKGGGWGGLFAEKNKLPPAL